MVVRRFEIFLVSLDPTIGRKIRKTRPCLVISPDEMNKYLDTVLAAPMTTRGRPYPTRVPCRFRGKAGYIALDQIRAIDRSRLIRGMGRIGPTVQDRVITILNEMFAR